MVHAETLSHEHDFSVTTFCSYMFTPDPDESGVEGEDWVRHPGKLVETKGINFMPSNEPYSENDGTPAYNSDIPEGVEDFENSVFGLETFTLLKVDNKDTYDKALKAVVLDSSATVMAVSKAVTMAASASACELEFVFEGVVPELKMNMMETYTITFVLGDSAIGVGDQICVEADCQSLLVYTSDGLEWFEQEWDYENDKPAEDENGEPIMSWFDNSLYSNEFLEFIPGSEVSGEVIEETEGEDSLLYAPAVCFRGYVISVPEPATAAMSLLALCGLAARRRRA